jgi:pyruvoyl-dependent arginine decarboxylase (PvlArgDC)
MLTPKQEAFAHAVASGKTQADAYRAAYDAANSKPATVQKRASELMMSGAIAGRVEELRRPIAEKAQITLETHLRDLMMLRNMAVKEKQISAAISAEIARGKAAGIHVERAELTGPGPNGEHLSKVTVEFVNKNT